MALTINSFTIVEGYEANGPIFHYRINVVGDAAYVAGGSVGILGFLRTLTKKGALNIIEVTDQSPPATTQRLEYDHANDKLFSRVRTTGVEAANGDYSANTYCIAVTAN